MVRLLLLLLFTMISFWSLAQVSSVQAAENIKDCESKVTALRLKIDEINREYKESVKDLQNGLFCSKCQRSKTEIEKTGEEFQQHVDRVEGEVRQAPPETFKKLYENYKVKYNDGLQGFEDQKKNCDEMKARYHLAISKGQQDSLDALQKKMAADQLGKYENLLKQLETNRKHLEDMSKSLSKAIQNMSSPSGASIDTAGKKKLVDADSFWGLSTSRDDKRRKSDDFTESARERQEEADQFPTEATFTVSYHEGSSNGNDPSVETDQHGRWGNAIKQGSFIFNDPKGRFSFEAKASSGYSRAANNPYSQNFKDTGLIPSGTWRVELITNPVTPMQIKEFNKHPPIFRLVPEGNVEMSYRDGGFLIHSGKNPEMASQGCIILDKQYRMKLKSAIEENGVVRIRVQNRIY